MTLEELNGLSGRIIGAAMAVHATLGPGLLESTYQACLLYELEKRGLRVQAQVSVPVVYDGQKLVDVGYRIDILVEDLIVLELKSVEIVAPVHKAQLLSYLRHSNKRLGLLINFSAVDLREGITRLINGY